MCTHTTFLSSVHCTTTNAVLVKNTIAVVTILPYALFTKRSGNISSPYTCKRKNKHQHAFIFLTVFHNRNQQTSINMLYFIQLTNSRHACSKNIGSKLELIHILNRLRIKRNACISNQSFDF